MKKIFSLITIAIFISSCASTNQYVKFVENQSRDKEYEYATIYIIRPGLVGAAVKFEIFENEKLVGRLGPNSYLSWTFPITGEDIHISNSISTLFRTYKEQIVINPTPGKVYYVKQNTLVNSDLEVISSKKANKLLRRIKKPKLKYIEG